MRLGCSSYKKDRYPLPPASTGARQPLLYDASMSAPLLRRQCGQFENRQLRIAMAGINALKLGSVDQRVVAMILVRSVVVPAKQTPMTMTMLSTAVQLTPRRNADCPAKND
jgi:hypothetical protein